MSDSPEALELECRAFTRYLVGGEPGEYVVTKYVAAHEALAELTPQDRFDALLVRMARGSAVFRAPAAAFARVFQPEGPLHSKLVVLLAILETAHPYASHFDEPPTGVVPVLVLVLGVRSVVAAVALVAGTLVLTPLGWAIRGPRGDR